MSTCKVFSIWRFVWQVTMLVIQKNWHATNLHKVQVLNHCNFKFTIHILHLLGGVVIVHKLLHIATICFMALYHMFLKIFRKLQSRKEKLKWFAFVAIIMCYPPPIRNSKSWISSHFIGASKKMSFGFFESSGIVKIETFMWNLL